MLLKERDLQRNPRRTRKNVLLISANLHSNNRRDCHDPNNLIQASFTKTMFALGNAAKQLRVEAQRSRPSKFIQSEQIYISANAAGMHSLSFMRADSKSRSNRLTSVRLPSGSYVIFHFAWIEHLKWQRFQFDLNSLTSVMQQSNNFPNVTAKQIKVHLR